MRSHSNAPGRGALTLAVAMATAVTVMVAGCSSSSKSGGGDSASSGTLTIPFIVSLTGSSAEFGQSDLIAVNLAVDKVNADGGIDGVKLKVDAKDDGGDAAQAATLMRGLTAGSAIVALGPVTSQTTGAAWPLAKRGKLPVVGNTQDITVVKAAQPYAFDGITTAIPLSKAAVSKWQTTVPNVKKVVNIVDKANAGSALSGQLFDTDLKAAGYDIVKTINVNEGQASYSSEAAQVKAANADGVILSAFGVTAGVILKAVRAAGVNSPVLLGSASLSAAMLKAAGSSAGNSWANVVFWPTAVTPAQKPFVDAYTKAANGVALQQPAPYLYDDVMLIANALKSSGALKMKGSTQDKREALRKAMATTSFTGVTGPFKINQDGYLDGQGSFLKIESDGTVTPLS